MLLVLRRAKTYNFIPLIEARPHWRGELDCLFRLRHRIIHEGIDEYIDISIEEYGSLIAFFVEAANYYAVKFEREG